MTKIQKNNNEYNINNAIEEVFLTPNEVLTIYKLSFGTQSNLRQNGLPYYKIGKLIRYNKEELNSWFKDRKKC